MVALALALAGVVASSGARAEDAARPAAGDDGGLREKKAAAAAHFERGFELGEQGDWRSALDEFEQSLTIYPTPTAALNRAVCLNRLRRSAEALEVYEELQRTSLDKLDAEQKKWLSDGIRELRPLVAEIALAGDAEDVTVTLDGRVVGSGGLPRTIYADPGAHVLRVLKPGYTSFELHLELTAGQHTAARARLEREGPGPDATSVVASTAAAATLASDTEQAKPHASSDGALPIFVEAIGGLAFSPSLAGGAEDDCEGSVTLPTGEVSARCDVESAPHGALLAARVGYRLLPPLALELSLGYFGLDRSLVRHVTGDAQSTPFTSDGMRDDLTMHAGFVAAGASYRWFQRWPVIARLSVGVGAGRVNAHDSGSFHEDPPFTAAAGSSPASDVGEFQLEEDPQTIWMFLLAPEVRFGFRANRHFMASIGVAFWLTWPTNVTRRGDVWGQDYRSAELIGDAHFEARTLTLPQESALGACLILIPSFALTWEF